MALRDRAVRIVRVGAADAVARHLARRCAPAVVARELVDPANHCLVADAGSRWLGYA